MTARFQDRVVLVTGAGSGIGRATAVAFAREGAHVVAGGRRAQGLRDTVAFIRGEGGEAEAAVADVTRAQDVARLVDTVISRHGRLDAACNNAGVPGTRAPLHEHTLDDWEQVTRTNLTGVWLAMKHEIAHMRRAGAGAVVNVSSIAGLVGYRQAAPYAASKHGVIGLTRTAALDHAGEGVRINAVCPGPVLTPMLDRARAERGPQAEDFYLSRIPMGRLGTPQEVAAAVLWLACDDAAYITGQALAVDGGWTAQ